MPQDAVVICQERCTDKSVARLNLFITTFNKFAWPFNLNFVIDAPFGEVCPVGEDKDVDAGNIYVHFESTPPDIANNPVVISGSVFGYEILKSESRELAASLSGYIIRSTEGIQVAYITGTDIYLLPGLFFSEGQEGGPAEDDNLKRILFMILYWSIPKAVGAGRKNLDECYRLLRDRMSRRVKRHGLGAIAVVDLEGFVSQRFVELRKTFKREVEALRVDAHHKTEEFFQLLTKRLDLQNALNSTKEFISERNLINEFERLHAIRHIKTVRVFPTLHKADIKINRPFLVLNTDRIFQRPSGKSQPDKYDLGEFEIVIDVAAMNHYAVHFFQDRYKGPYSHAHATHANVCFGTHLDEGLNSAIDKLMADVDIVPLVHLIISFLIKESSIPVERNLKRDFLKEQYQPSPDNEYRSREDREKEKGNFVALINSVIQERTLKNLQSRIAELSERIEVVCQRRLHIRALIKEKELLLSIIESRIKNLRAFISDEIKSINDHLFVFNIVVRRNELHMNFMLQDNILHSRMTGLLGYTLRIRHSAPPQLVFPARHGLMTTVVSLTKDDLAMSDRIDDNLEKDIIGYLNQFELARLLETIKKLLIPTPSAVQADEIESSGE